MTRLLKDQYVLIGPNILAQLTEDESVAGDFPFYVINGNYYGQYSGTLGAIIDGERSHKLAITSRAQPPKDTHPNRGGWYNEAIPYMVEHAE